MKNDQFLNEAMPHRLRGNEVLFASAHLYMRVLERAPESRAKLLIDGDTVIEGAAFSLLNPLVEAGLVNLRSLVEFLGVKYDEQRKLRALTTRKPSDIGIEQFFCDGKALSKVTPDTLCSLAKGCTPDEAREALSHTLQMSNQAVAHITSDHQATSTDLRRVVIASQCVGEAVIKFLYEAMRLEPVELGLRIVRK